MISNRLRYRIGNILDCCRLTIENLGKFNNDDEFLIQITKIVLNSNHRRFFVLFSDLLYEEDTMENVSHEILERCRTDINKKRVNMGW